MELNRSIKIQVKKWMKIEYIQHPDIYHDREGNPISAYLAESFINKAGIKVESQFEQEIQNLAIDVINNF